MPNGRSGGFVIETADLRRLLEALTGNEVVGHLLTGSKPHRPRRQAARVDEITRVIENCPHSRIAVEEQDYTFYIVHVSNEPELVWVLISSESALFTELRRRHAEWVAEHPGWDGWIGF